MGTYETTKEERIYKIEDRFLLMGFYAHDDECGKSHVQITELPEDKLKSYFEGHKIEEMPKWMNNEEPEIICIEDFMDTVEAGIERAFEDMWCDDLTDEECDKIPEKLKEKIEKKLTKNILHNCKGLD